MALLPLPALANECAHAHNPSLSSWGALSSCKLFLDKPIQSRNRGYKLAIASFTEVQKHPRQRPSHSPKRFSDSSSSSSTKKTVGSPSSWKPSHKKSNKHASTRYRPFSQQDSYRGGRGSHWEVEDGESVDSSSGSLSQGTAMARIVEKLRDIQRTFESPPQKQPLSSKQNAEAESGCISRTLPTRTAGELFLPKPKENLFSIGNYWSTPDHPIPAPGRGALETKFGWDFEEPDRQEEEEKKKRVKPPTLADVIIPPDQLRRLRTLGIALTNSVRVGRLGVTDNIADKIIGRWRSQELVKVKCGGPAAINMMKIHKDLERKTGGLVVWRAGSVAVIYRGSDYDELKRVSTSLEKKLDGLLSEGNILQKTSLNAKPVDATKALSEISEVRLDSSLDAGGSELQFNVMPNDLRKEDTIDPDAVFSDSILNVNSTGISPYTGEVKGTQETVPSPQVDATSVVQQPTESGNEERDHASTASEPEFIYRKLNVAPDPFVDRDYEIETDNVLESLGPRCQNWTGATPVPIDADLLPPLIPNYRPPYRLLPYGVRPQLTNNEQTDLRRLVRHVTPHFVLGRNRGQQGLAAAILKLWEKTEVVKIAVKSGVQNTSSEKMAEELKRCTGGVILARDRYFITLYRGKDFLPQHVAFALTERTTMLRNLTKEDETVEGGISTINPSGAAMMKQKEERAKVNAEAEKARRLALAEQLEEKLALALEKKGMAEKDLEMLEAFSTPVEQPVDKETTATVEEKYMFRRLGLKMKPFLLIGRRGVFNGVVENMHLHWKHRELVKLIVKERDRAQLQKTARILEKESGGVLITVEGTSKGQAIIIYRGKNYERPENLRPLNLLDNKKALERSLEVQRRESLSRQISALEREINKLKSSLSDADKEKADVLDAALDKLSTSSDLKEEGVFEDDQVGTHVPIKDFSGKGSLAQAVCSDKKELLELVRLGPIYRATRLSNLERLKLRKLALKLSVTARFNVGKSNVLLGLARAIRIHFLKHAFAVVGMKNRGRGTSIQDLVHELEDLTGGVLVSHEEKEILMYRGWPTDQKMPISGAVENVSPELLAALEADKEDDWDTDNWDTDMTETRDISDEHDNVEGDGDDKDDGVDPDPSVMAEASDIYDNVGDEEHLSMTDDVSDDDVEEDWDGSSMTEDVSDDDEKHLSMLLADTPGTEGYSGAEILDLCGRNISIS